MNQRFTNNNNKQPHTRVVRKAGNEQASGGVPSTDAGGPRVFKRRFSHNDRPRGQFHHGQNPSQNEGPTAGGFGTRPRSRMSRPPRRSMRPPLPATKKTPDEIPPLAPGDLRVIPIGGVEEITKNMTVVEYKDQIIIIDAGILMGDSGPGVQTTIPDITYLEERKHMIKAMVITHGHLDHIGAIPFVIEKLGNPPIYTREFGALIIKKRQEEYPDIAPLDIRIVEKDQGAIRLSDDFKVIFFGLTHSIPDSTGVVLETPFGDIVSTGDVRVENIDGVPVPSEVEQYKFFRNRNVLMMTMDSTGIPIPGWSLAESIVINTVDGLIRDTKGRLFIGAFASQVERLIKFIESAKRYGRYVVIEGRAMKTNISIVQHLGLTDLSHVIPVEDMHKYPPNKIMILATGSQGEPYSLLDRVANGAHKYIKLNEHDTIIFSSSVVPGNDRVVDELKDRLYRFNPKVITYADTQVHSSGHGRRAELEWIHQQVNYKFFMPIHGSHYRLKMHQDVVLALKPDKTKDDIIVPDNGTIIEFRENGTKMVRLEARAPHNRIIIDGSYVGPAHEIVLRDRKMLSEDGMFVVVTIINPQTMRLRKSPDIVSRGFIYLRDNQDLLYKCRGLIKKTAEDTAAETNLDIEAIKNEIGERVSRFLLQKTEKRPIVIPVVLAF